MLLLKLLNLAGKKSGNAEAGSEEEKLESRI
jgi:hypothetical protein